MLVPGLLPSQPGHPRDRRSLDLQDNRVNRERARGLRAAPLHVRRVARTSLWIALLALAALLPAIRLADAQDPQTLVSNVGTASNANTALTLGEEFAQGFTTGANPAGYTLTSIVVAFGSIPAGLSVKLLIGLPTAPAEVATLNNPVSAVGLLSFTAPANTVLSPNTTYFVHLQATAGSLAFTPDTAEDSDGAEGWSIGDAYYELVSGGTWTQPGNDVFRISVNGYVGGLSPAIEPSPDPANFARGPVQWLGQGQHQSQDEAQSSTHTFPARFNEFSADQPTNPSGSLDLAPITASVSENLRQQSRGFYLTTTVDPPSDTRWLFRRTPEGGYAVEDPQSRRYELAPGAALLKLRLWHIYHHLGRGLNSVQLLGGSTINDRDNRLTQPLQLCLPAPDNSGNSAERARIAVRGRYDRHWTILETTLTDDGRICADTVRIAWLVVVLQPPPPSAA